MNSNVVTVVSLLIELKVFVCFNCLACNTCTFSIQSERKELDFNMDSFSLTVTSSLSGYRCCVSASGFFPILDVPGVLQIVASGEGFMRGQRGRSTFF